MAVSSTAITSFKSTDIYRTGSARAATFCQQLADCAADKQAVGSDDA